MKIEDRSAALAGLFDYAVIDEDLFRAPPTHAAMKRLYGGQVLAHALSAAQRTVPVERAAHSVHACFVRAGDPALPLDFRVLRDSDGRSFSARRVEAIQGGRIILTMTVSLHVPEDGPSHQMPMPDVPGPEMLVPQSTIIEAVGDRLPPRHQTFWLSDIGVDFRAVEPFVTFDPPPVPARRHFWMRFRDSIGDDPAAHVRLFAYASDMYLMHTGLLPIGVGWAESQLQDASLDHAIWYHEPFRVDRWLLYALDSPRAGHARTLARGLVFTEAGRLVATVAQEGLIRLPPGFAGRTPSSDISRATGETKGSVRR